MEIPSNTIEIVNETGNVRGFLDINAISLSIALCLYRSMEYKLILYSWCMVVSS